MEKNHSQIYHTERITNPGSVYSYRESEHGESQCDVTSQSTNTFRDTEIDEFDAEKMMKI